MTALEEEEAKRELEMCMYPIAYGSRHIMTREDYEWLLGRLDKSTGPHKEAMRRALGRAASDNRVQA